MDLKGMTYFPVKCKGMNRDMLFHSGAYIISFSCKSFKRWNISSLSTHTHTHKGKIKEKVQNQGRSIIIQKQRSYQGDKREKADPEHKQKWPFLCNKVVIWMWRSLRLSMLVLEQTQAPQVHIFSFYLFYKSIFSIKGHFPGRTRKNKIKLKKNQSKLGAFATLAKQVIFQKKMICLWLKTITSSRKRGNCLPKGQSNPRLLHHPKFTSALWTRVTVLTFY